MVDVDTESDVALMEHAKICGDRPVNVFPNEPVDALLATIGKTLHLRVPVCIRSVRRDDETAGVDDFVRERLCVAVHAGSLTQGRWLTVLFLWA